MIAVNRILVPTDRSTLATRALRYALDLAKYYRAELHVLHVVTHSPDAAIAGVGPTGESSAGLTLVEDLGAKAKREAESLSSLIDGLAADLPIAAMTTVRIGAPWQEIVQYADEAGIDLIVIGTHARKVMKRILLGSTSKSVLEHVACPVLMVPLAAIKKDHAAAAAAGIQIGTGG